MVVGIVDILLYLMERYFIKLIDIVLSDFLIEVIMKIVIKYGFFFMKDRKNYNYCL